MSLAGVHDTGIVTVLHVVEQDLLESEHGNMENGSMRICSSSQSSSLIQEEDTSLEVMDLS